MDNTVPKTKTEFFKKTKKQTKNLAIAMNNGRGIVDGVGWGVRVGGDVTL